MNIKFNSSAYEHHKIFSFNLQNIRNSKKNFKIKPLHKTINQYFNRFQGNFVILPNEQTIIGYNANSGKLQLENICSNSPAREIEFEIIDSLVHTILYNFELKALLIGFSNGRLLQYLLGKRGKLTMDKDYGDIGINCISVSTLLGNIAAIGGTYQNQMKFKKYCRLKLLDMNLKVLVSPNIKTAICSIKSLSFGETSDQIFLGIAGAVPNYLAERTDIFDAKQLFKNYLLQSNKNKADAFIDHLKLALSLIHI